MIFCYSQMLSGNFSCQHFLGRGESSIYEHQNVIFTKQDNKMYISRILPELATKLLEGYEILTY